VSAELQFFRNRSGAAEVLEHLHACVGAFIPPLGDRVDLAAYAGKLASRAERFEAWDGGRLAGLVAAYCNDPGQRTAFITSVSVLECWKGRGIAARLLSDCLDHARASGFLECSLEVGKHNEAALRLYAARGFAIDGESEGFIRMKLNLKGTLA